MRRGGWPKIFKKGDTIQRTITTRFTWTPSGATKNTITPYWYFGGTANITPIANPLEVEKAKLDIRRCDSEVPNARHRLRVLRIRPDVRHELQFIKEQRLMEDDDYRLDLGGFTTPTP